MKLGYIGIGTMGGALARRIMREHELRVFDLDASLMQAFAGEGALPTQNPRALAAECDIVMTCLPTSEDVRSVLDGDDGVLAGIREGGIVADMTTGDPMMTRAMAARALERGIRLIDAPVSGGPHGATAGTITIMVGAPTDVFERVKPVFETISPNVFHTGDVGTGHTMKLVNNVIAAGIRMVTFEAVTMGIKSGLDLDTCATVLAKGSGRSYYTEHTLPDLADGTLQPSFALGLMHKDVRLATQLGVQVAAPMHFANLVREFFQDSVNEFGPGVDVNYTIDGFERRAGIKLKP